MKRDIGISGGQAYGTGTSDQVCYELLDHLALLPDFPKPISKMPATSNQQELFVTVSRLLRAQSRRYAQLLNYSVCLPAPHSALLREITTGLPLEKVPHAK
jgi:hypothetical protein